MQDLAEATAGSGDLLMLGGGNPAHIPQVQQCLRESCLALAQDPAAFARAFGTYDPPQGNEAFIQALCTPAAAAVRMGDRAGERGR